MAGRTNQKQGLAKFSHLINQQFFGDLLEALKDLIRHADTDENGNGDPEATAEADDEDEETTRNTTREALLCTTTAFALLAGQDAHNAKADLHLDLTFFTTHLWQTLLPTSLNPDLELGARSLHLPDPDAPGSSASKPTSTRGNKVNLQTTTVLLIRCLTGILLPPWNIRSTPPLRLAAFAKQLMSTSLHVPEKSAQALLALLADVGNTHGRKIAALWNTEERKGDGVFNALASNEEGSNPFAATVWEGELLRRHYCPKVRNGAKLLEKTIMSEK
jgi:nucleolar complex protein 3